MKSFKEYISEQLVKVISAGRLTNPKVGGLSSLGAEHKKRANDEFVQKDPQPSKII